MTRKERLKVSNGVQSIKDISQNNFAKKVKKNWKNNIKGALVGGGLGVVVAIATRKSPLVLGVLGLILGRIVFKSNKK
jgi:hypothetical protein